MIKHPKALLFDSDSRPLRHGLCSGRPELQEHRQELPDEQRQGMYLQDLRLWEMSEGTSLLNYTSMKTRPNTNSQRFLNFALVAGCLFAPLFKKSSHES
jgi:hypothetical protein